MRDGNLSTADFVAGGQDAHEEHVENMDNRPEARPGGAAAAREEAPGPLLAPDRTGEMRHRWDEIQTAFVDEPRAAVQKADQLVAEAMKQIAEGFAGERSRLEQQWDRGDEVNTEDLRQALRKYRAFFQRLLSV